MGEIKSDAVYSKETFCRLAGISKHSWAGLKRAGFPIKRIGARCYVAGQDWIDWVNRCPAGEHVSTAQSGR